MSYFGPNGSPLHNEEDDVTNREEVETDMLDATEAWSKRQPDIWRELDRLIVELAAVERQRAELIAGIRKLLPPGVVA